MKQIKIFSNFIPWIIFSIYEGQSAANTSQAGFVAAIITIILSRKQIKRFFILPLASLIFFIFTWINSSYINLPIIETYNLLINNLALPSIILISIIIGKPFTIEYAREKTDQAYWQLPMFIKINYLLSIMWLIIITTMNLPNILIEKRFLLDSMLINYAYIALCLGIALWLNKSLPNALIGRNFWNIVKKLPPINSPFLKNGFAPVYDELDIKDLEIEGTIPSELNGCYLRNGPNPYFKPYTYTYPVDGDGMIHQITIRNGQASYKNKFVKTKGFIAEKKAKMSLYGGIALPIIPDPRFVIDNANKNTASINIIPWQNKFLALYEASPAYILDRDLNTIGKWEPEPNFLVNAHQRIDSDTSQTYMFSYNTNQANIYLTLYEFDYRQRLVKQLNIKKPLPTMIHDFVITKNYLVFFDAPAIFNILGNKGDKPFFYYDNNIKLRIILVNRRTYEVTNIEDVDGFFVYHFINAYEENNKIILDFICYKKLELISVTYSNNPSQLYRGEIDLDTMRYSHHPLNIDTLVEFPTYNQKYTAKKYRYAYMLAKTNDKDLGLFNQIIKYDLLKNKSQAVEIMPNTELSEATFIPSSNPTTEDDGYLALFVYHPSQERSDFVILSAKHPDKVIARIKLPVRVPHGLHGSWVPDSVT